MGARRRSWLQATTAAALLAAAPAQAEWKSMQQVTLGTAQVLEQGAATIGVISPLAFGLTGQLTLQTHPILMLLLTPNAAARYRLVDQGNYVISASAAIKRSLGGSDASNADVPAPGELVAGGLASVYLGPHWALTGGVHYAAHLDEQVGEELIGVAHGAALTAEVHHLLTPSDLLQASMYLRYGVSHGGLAKPVTTLAWTHGFRRFGGVHLMVILTAFDVDGAAPGGWLSDLPALPTIDLWWRL